MKYLGTLLVALGCVLGSYAQDGGSSSNMRFGLRLSPNVSWFNPDTRGIESKGIRFGYSYGATADFAISGSSNYWLSTGFDVVDMGGKLEYPDVAYPTDNNANNFPATSEDVYRLRYIEVPITLKMKTNEIGYLTYYGQIGFGVGLNIRARRDLDQNYTQGTLTIEDEDVGSDIFPLRTSLIVGGGAEYNLSGNTSLLVGLTFNNGFIDILEGDYFEIDDQTGNVNVGSDNLPVSGPKRKATNTYLALNLGVLF